MKMEDIPTGAQPPITINPEQEAGQPRKDQTVIEVQQKLQEISDHLGEIITTMQNSSALIRSWIEQDQNNGNK